MADTFVITDSGLGIVNNRINGVGNEPYWVGWGIGTTAASASNTALESERAEARVSASITVDTTTTTNDTYRAVATLVCASTTAAITEVGMFNASAGGTMFARGTFAALNLEIGNSVEFTLDSLANQG